MSLALPSLLQTPRRNLDAVASEVVKHDNIGTRFDGLVGLGLALYLDLDLNTEAGDRLGGLDGVGDTAAAPYMVVLEHNHGAQVHAVGVGAADQHAVLLNEAETGSRLARAGENSLVSRSADAPDEVAAAAGDTGTAGKGVESDALAEEDAADGSADRGNAHLAAVCGQVKLGALLCVPLDGAAALGEDLVEEGSAGDDARGFAPEGSDAGGLADDEAGVVHGRRVFGEPAGDGGFPRGGEEGGQAALVRGGGHCEGVEVGKKEGAR